MRVLDVSAGRRNVWMDRHYAGAVFLDIRAEVLPDVVGDSRALPFAAGAFDLVVFDPPHTNIGATGHMSHLYGHYTQKQIRSIVIRTGREIARVLRQDGLLAFKWSDHGGVSVKKAVSWLPHVEPLFGHVVSVRTRHVSTTQWVMLRRRDDFAAADETWRQYAEAA